MSGTSATRLRLTVPVFQRPTVSIALPAPCANEPSAEIAPFAAPMSRKWGDGHVLATGSGRSRRCQMRRARWRLRRRMAARVVLPRRSCGRCRRGFSVAAGAVTAIVDGRVDLAVAAAVEAMTIRFAKLTGIEQGRRRRRASRLSRHGRRGRSRRPLRRGQGPDPRLGQELRRNPGDELADPASSALIARVSSRWRRCSSRRSRRASSARPCRRRPSGCSTCANQRAARRRGSGERSSGATATCC